MARTLSPAHATPRRNAPCDPALVPIARKVEAGERLTAAEGAALFATPDIHGVLRLADLVRRRLHGDQAFFNVNRHLNYSNICALSLPRIAASTLSHAFISAFVS